MSDAHLIPLAEAIEEALTDWARVPASCSYSDRCPREDCRVHKDAPGVMTCRAGCEYIAAKISGAAKDCSAINGWIIANGAGDRFRTWGAFGPEWTGDRDAALQFARRRDADAFARDDEDAWKILPLYGRDPQERIDELLRSNNELLERARKAEADVGLVRQELAAMGERIAEREAQS